MQGGTGPPQLLWLKDFQPACAGKYSPVDGLGLLALVLLSCRCTSRMWLDTSPSVYVAS
jgi:hypothetical protein